MALRLAAAENLDWEKTGKKDIYKKNKTLTNKQSQVPIMRYLDEIESRFYVFGEKQVSSNKDKSEGRDEDRIAERYRPNRFAGCLLQIACRNIAIMDPYLDFHSDSMPFPINSRS